jgi:hypothetical protein
MVQWLRTGTQRQHGEKELQNTTSYSLNETEAIEIMTLSDVYSSHRMLLLGHHNIWEVLRKTTRWRQTARRHNAYQPTWKSDHFSLGHDNERIQISKTLKRKINWHATYHEHRDFYALKTSPVRDRLQPLYKKSPWLKQLQKLNVRLRKTPRSQRPQPWATQSWWDQSGLSTADIGEKHRNSWITCDFHHSESYPRH